MNILPLILALAIVSCASAPPAPSAPDSSGIAIGVEVFPPVHLFSQKPEQVLFVRLWADDDSFTSGDLMLSNYASGGYVYLLNAPPGTYVAVSCFKDVQVPAAPGAVSGSMKYMTYFPENMIRETRVTVKPGRIAFMGSFTVDQKVGWKDGDATQLAYDVLLGDYYLTNAIGADAQNPGTLHASDHGALAQAAFVKSANSRLIAAGWKPQSEH